MTEKSVILIHFGMTKCVIQKCNKFSIYNVENKNFHFQIICVTNIQHLSSPNTRMETFNIEVLKMNFTWIALKNHQLVYQSISYDSLYSTIWLNQGSSRSVWRNSSEDQINYMKLYIEHIISHWIHINSIHNHRPIRYRFNFINTIYQLQTCCFSLHSLTLFVRISIFFAN